MKGASGQTKQNERNEKRRSISRKERAPSGILLIYIYIRMYAYGESCKVVYEKFKEILCICFGFIDFWGTIRKVNIIFITFFHQAVIKSISKCNSETIQMN